MAVYTKYNHNKIEEILSNYDLGKLDSFKGIEEGIENTNYFLSVNKKKFIYIDRVVVKDGYRRMGFGTKFYKYLDKVASEQLLPICCEVNSIPRNEISMNFHINNGFKEVGKRDFQDHSVKYFEKNI